MPRSCHNSNSKENGKLSVVDIKKISADYLTQIVNNIRQIIPLRNYSPAAGIDKRMINIPNFLHLTYFWDHIQPGTIIE